jgi:hypothetical protein
MRVSSRSPAVAVIFPIVKFPEDANKLGRGNPNSATLSPTFAPALSDAIVSGVADVCRRASSLTTSRADTRAGMGA